MSNKPYEFRICLIRPITEKRLSADNIGPEWEKWLRGHRKRAWLLHFAGDQVREIFDNLPGANIQAGPLAERYVTDGDVYQTAIAVLNEYFLPKRNPTTERLVFRMIKQEKNEEIEMFVIRLRKQAEKCDYGTAVEERIKDQITEKCISSKLRRRILEKGAMTLQEIVSVAKILEAVAEQEKLFEKPNQSELTTAEPVNKIEPNKFGKPNQHVSCNRCGKKEHKSFDISCPAKGKKCF